MGKRRELEGEWENLKKELGQHQETLVLETSSLGSRTAEAREAKLAFEKSLASGKDSAKQEITFKKAESAEVIQGMKVRGVEAQVDRLTKAVAKVGASIRAEMNRILEGRGAKKLGRLQIMGDEAIEIMRELAIIQEGMERNVLITTEKYRRGPVKVQYLDKDLIDLYSSKKTMVRERKSPGAPEEFFVSKKDALYGMMEYAGARRLEKAGKVKVIDDGPAYFDSRIVEEKRPEILADIVDADAGRPATIFGETSAAARRLRDILGFNFTINTLSACQLFIGTDAVEKYLRGLDD